DIARWQVWQAAHLSSAADGLMYEALAKPMMKQPTDPEKLAMHTASFHRWASVLDGALATADYLATERFTCADIPVAAALTYAAPARMPIDEHPALRAWFDRIQARPSWQATAPRM